MALKKLRTLDNGLTADYHMITDVSFSKRRKSLTIFWAGFKDQAFRTANWSEAINADNTDQTAVYKDTLFINGQDFIDNILPQINNAGNINFAYNLIKARVPYLIGAIDVL